VRNLNGGTHVASAEFFGGPHDGLILSINDIPRWCQFVKANRGEDARHFAVMPPPKDWKRVVRGKLRKSGPFNSTYWYELFCSNGRLVFVILDADEVIAATRRS
jgi:hypothetical protein